MSQEIRCYNLLSLFHQLKTQKPGLDAAFDNGDFVKAKNLRKTIDKIIRDIWLEIKVRRREELTIGGVPKIQLLNKLNLNQVYLNNVAEDIISNDKFSVVENPERIILAWLRVSDLGFEDKATTEQIYKRAKELGFNICSAEAGVHHRLKYINQPFHQWYYIAMEQIVTGGMPRIFYLGRDSDNLCLEGRVAFPWAQWPLDTEFVFCLDQEEK